MRSLISSKGRSYFDDLFGPFSLEVPYLLDRVINSLPTVYAIFILGIEVKLFLFKVILLKEAELLDFCSKFYGDVMIIQFVDVRLMLRAVGFQELYLPLL